MYPGPRSERLYRDVGDDSPWYEKALFHALSSLWHGDDPEDALRKIETVLAERSGENGALSSPRTDVPNTTEETR